jgi:hypothetical protein
MGDSMMSDQDRSTGQPVCPPTPPSARGRLDEGNVASREPVTRQRRARPGGIRLGVLHRRLSEGVLVLLAATGLVWLVLRFGDSADCDPEACLARWIPVVLKVHGAAAMAVLLVLGSLLQGHVVTAWRARRNRAAGATLLGGAILLVASGWGLYYLGGEWSRAATSVLHWVLGIACVPVFMVHLARGRRTRRITDISHD